MDDGLVFSDLNEWQRWQHGRQPISRRIKASLRGVPAEPVVTVSSNDPRILIAVEGFSTSNRLALLSVVDHLDPRDVAVMAPADAAPHLPSGGWRSGPAVPPSLNVVLAAGHYGVGARAWSVAEEAGLPFFVSQHGLLTPLAPPLPPGSHLLAWSEADAEFWGAGERTVVGSELLWQAAQRPAGTVMEQPLMYLGQGHAAELPRGDLVAAAAAFCSQHSAIYRPHPGEVDRGSRRQLERLRAAGVPIDRSGSPLAESNRPVVSAFSTGVLEAAARGIPAWVDYPDSPPWLREFWSRYQMAPYGGDPTPAPDLADGQPAASVAAVLSAALD